MLIQNPTFADQGYQGVTFENMLRSSISSGILTVDSDRISAITAEADRILRIVSGTAGFRSVMDLPETLQEVIREVQSTGETVTNRPVALRTGSRVLNISVSATPSIVPKSDSGVVMSLKDDTALGYLENNLRRLDRLASAGLLSASMAHEIKNALVAVRTFVELLLEKNADTDLSAVVRREVGRVDTIVSHMLTYSSPAQPTFSNFGLHDLLDHSLRLVQHGSPNKLIAFKRDFLATPDVIAGDDHQLQQVFVNLLFNAVEAMPGEGSLTISTDLIADENRPDDGTGAGRLMRIRISDTGAGIDPDQLQHIFEPFFTTKPSGTGLGLAVTRRIVKEHKGTIHVESVLGRGTTFVILLPITR